LVVVSWLFHCIFCYRWQFRLFKLTKFCIC